MGQVPTKKLLLVKVVLIIKVIMHFLHTQTPILDEIVVGFSGVDHAKAGPQLGYHRLVVCLLFVCPVVAQAYRGKRITGQYKRKDIHPLA
jgi:hypothetical protein